MVFGGNTDHIKVRQTQKVRKFKLHPQPQGKKVGK